MAYQYESLAHPEYEIRVAVLQPGEFIDDVQVKFVVRNLNDCKYRNQALLTKLCRMFGVQRRILRKSLLVPTPTLA
jgi:hypothetical protein